MSSSVRVNKTLILPRGNMSTAAILLMSVMFVMFTPFHLQISVMSTTVIQQPVMFPDRSQVWLCGVVQRIKPRSINHVSPELLTLKPFPSSLNIPMVAQDFCSRVCPPVDRLMLSLSLKLMESCTLSLYLLDCLMKQKQLGAYEQMESQHLPVCGAVHLQEDGVYHLLADEHEVLHSTSDVGDGRGGRREINCTTLDHRCLATGSTHLVSSISL